MIRCRQDDGYDTYRNAFDIQFLNCGDISLEINDPNDPYPPQAYNTELTLT